MSLLHEEHARAGLKLFLNELELALGQTESLDILRGVRIRVWKEDLRRRLLDDRARDRARKRIAWALRRRTKNPVQLAPDLEAILGELLEGGIGEQARELVRPAHEAPPIEERPDDVEEIQRDRCAGDLVVQEFGDVRPEERRPGNAGREGVRRIIERP